MELNEQLKVLIDDAPKYGVPAIVIQQAVAPVLSAIANQLQHLEYYVLQNLEQNWILTTVSNSKEPETEKKIIYAFASLEDAATFIGREDPNILAISLPVTHILFQLFSMKRVDSIVFVNTPGNWQAGIELSRVNLQNLINQQIQQLGNLPPNIA